MVRHGGRGQVALALRPRQAAESQWPLLREADDARLAELVAPRLAKAGYESPDLYLLTRAMPVLKVRAKDLNELAEGAEFLAKRPLAFSEKAQALLTDEARGRLAAMHERLSSQPEWALEALESSLKAMAEDLGLASASSAQPLRAALTGQTTSPGIFDVLVLPGRDGFLARIGAQADASTGSHI